MVAVKGFEMPECCSDCTLNSCFNWTHYCNVTLQEVDFEAETRPADCPLVEIEECKTGKWEYKQLGFRAYGIICTICGYVIRQGYDFTSMEEFKDMVERELQYPHATMDKYCRKCGSKMSYIPTGSDLRGNKND